MGNYISRTDVANRLRRSYDTLYTPPGESSVDTDLVDADIDAAEGTVDGYLSNRFVVPITDSAALRICKAWALTLVEELAYGAIPGRELPESIASRANAVRKQLEEAGDGKLALGTATTLAEAAGTAGALTVEVEDPVFTRETMEGF